MATLVHAISEMQKHNIDAVRDERNRSWATLAQILPYNGAYKIKDEYGCIEEGFMKNGKQHGLWKRWVDEELNMMGEYVDGVREGQWMDPHDERFREFGRYKNDQRDGVWTVRCYDNDDKPHPPRRAWESYLEQTHYKDGVRQGAYQLHHRRTGNLICHGGFKDDCCDGAWYYYYPNGKLKKHGFYKDGRKVDIWRRYDKNGKLIKLAVGKNEWRSKILRSCIMQW